MAVYVAIAGAVIAGASAIYSADRQRYAANTQQDYLLRQAAYNRSMLDFQEQQRLLMLQAAYEQNAFDMQAAAFMEMRYGMQLELLQMTAELAGQRYAMEQEIYEWQLATLDWEAEFKMQQAELIAEKGSLARELFGVETAKLLAKERARMAAAGVQIGTGSPLEILGALKGEREFAEDIMKFESDVDVWGKEFEAKQLLNEKNKVKFGEFGSALDYQGKLADIRYEAGVAGMSKALASLQGGLLAGQRTRIGQGAVIDLAKYNTSRYYADVLTGMQSDIYGSAARGATVGGYLNTGATVFNSFNSYYTSKNKYSTGVGAS